MILQLAGLAIDTRCALPSVEDPRLRATAARWIAANALAATQVRVSVEGLAPRAACVLSLRAPCFAAALAALAAIPSLLDPSTLPRSWRLALRALGIPCLDRSSSAAISEGVPELGCGPGSCDLFVDSEADGYRVRVGRSERILFA